MSNEFIIERYWVKQLKGVIPSLAVFQQALSEPGKAAFDSTVLELPTQLLEDIDRITNHSAFGRYCIMLTALGILLSRYSGEEDILITTAEYKPGNGFDAENVSFLRNNVDPTLTLKELLLSYKDKIRENLKHQSYDYRVLLDKLQAGEKERRNLFQIGFVDGTCQNACEGIRQCDAYMVFSGEGTKFSLTLHFSSGPTSPLAAQFLRHYRGVLTKIMRDPGIRAGSLEILDPSEKEEILGRAGHDMRPLAFCSLPFLFRKTVSHIPDARAVAWGDHSMTYQELDLATDQLARYLIAYDNIHAGDVVALCMPTSINFMVCIIGVLKTGAAVLLMAPAENVQRDVHIMEDSRAKLLITEDRFSEISRYGAACDGSIALPAIDPKGAAFILYTSGSTGKPKGACLTHDSLNNMLFWYASYFDFRSTDVFPQKTTVTFGDSIVELLLPLTYGSSTVYLRPWDDVIRDAGALVKWLKDIRTTILQFVPSVFESIAGMADIGTLSHLRALVLSGEEVKGQYNFKFDVFNLYGCSEGTASSTICRLENNGKTSRSIGKPIFNTEVLIMDKHLQLLPLLVVGEIYIAGRSLASGYLNNKQLTSEKFIPHPYRPGEWMYRTGDMGKLKEGYEIEYCGRRDNQIKINGIRIEASEIETALSGHPRIRSAFVSLAEGSILAAYIVLREPVGDTEIRAYLGQRLPSYFVPQIFVRLQEIPMTTSGKVDRKRLPPVKRGALRNNTEFVPPATAMEQQLAGIWKEVFQSEENIGVEHNFIDLGGHSLLAIKLLSRIEKELGINISFRNFFQSPTIRGLAAVIRDAESSRYEEIRPAAPKACYELSRAQKRLWILDQAAPGSITYNMSQSYTLKGHLDVNAFVKAYEAIMRRHEILRTIFVMSGGEPGQKVLPYEEETFKLHYHDLRINNDAAAVAAALIEKATKHAFDLSRAPLITGSLYRCGEDEYAFVCVLHHILSDGWSFRVMVRELLALYEAFRRGMPDPLETLSIQYKDYAEWHNRLLALDTAGASKAYWSGKLKGDIPVLSWPRVERVEKRLADGGALRRFIMDADLTARLLEYNAERQITLFISLTAFLKVLLYKLTRESDILLGTPVAGRNHTMLENQIGLYINNLVLRDQLKEEMSFAGCVAAVKQTVLEAFDHQEYPYDQIVEDLQVSAPRGKNPFYDVLIVMAPDEGMDIVPPDFGGGLGVEALRVERTISKLDLTFFFSLSDHLHLGIEYKSHLFDEVTIDKMAEGFESLVRYAMDHPDCTVQELKASMADAGARMEHMSFSDMMTKVVEEDF
ncbi:condensation domain-containing protein [Flavitalea sp. BT771]|uniref:condensation domain-containing protein n=1 Tax=Flavitalea sp. BT771 TaxID=3063329 RepID=UPI0026E463AF|nr:condensation domain-containing protein [Flavitalea sp. BT771]MDO6435721.1 condensation domain-containing protein [Flavitalea sp. BT771]MDV6224632.1 condensation domain-containing protein [Flavitalea sp. BT771]